MTTTLRPRRAARLALFASVAALSLIAPAAGRTSRPPERVTTTPHLDEHEVILRRTRHGVVHVTAGGYRGAGFGVAYAYTEDNRCLLARRIEEVNGRLAAQLGADALVRNEVHDVTYTALQSDHYFRGWFDIEAIRGGFAAGAGDVRELARGYADGVNRFRADHPLLPPCEVEFTGPVTIDDVYRMWVATAGVASGDLASGLLPLSAPGSALGAFPSTASNAAGGRSGPSALRLRHAAAGSNAWAIGREATRKGNSVHLYNPHFPWSGIQRLYMIHVTVPGRLDVMGATLGGFPIPLSGFTRDVAWGLTFSTAARWTLAELALEGGPTTYRTDGVLQTITAEHLEIPVRGEPEPRVVPFFRAGGHPLLDADPFFFGWWDDPSNPGRAYAAHDVNADNTRIVEQFLRIAQARNVHELRDQLAAIQGVPWSYVVASDADGAVFFGDVSAVPGVSTFDVLNCVVSPVGAFYLPQGIVVLDGTRSACSWSDRMAASDQPQVIRTDYVANSNNTYELPNAAVRLTGFSPVLGIENVPGLFENPLALRPALGLRMIGDRLAGRDGLGKPGFTSALARRVFFQARNLGAELLVDGIVDDCRAHPTGEHAGATIDLSGVCEALARWDRRNTIESRGAVVFRGLWMALAESVGSHDLLFATPASIDAPLTTPSGYTADPLVRTAVRNALARVASMLEARGISPSVRWGEVNAVQTPVRTFPMPGGQGQEGIFDATVSGDAFYSFDGWSETLAGADPARLYGASYLQVVTLGPKGPSASGLLPYGQATEPSSPWYLDQVQRWSRNDWMRLRLGDSRSPVPTFVLPFTEAEIAADSTGTVGRFHVPPSRATDTR